MASKHFLTVDWCSQGKRGIFCKSDGNAFWKMDEPHTEDEMYEILGVFELVLAPQSILISEDELKQYNKWLPLEEYSNVYGFAFKGE